MSISSILLPENAVTIQRGTSKTLKLEVTTSDWKVVDLTGAIVYFTVRREIGDSHAVIQKSSNDVLQVEITEPRKGLAKIYLAPGDSMSMDLEQHVFDVLVIMASGQRHVVVGPSPFLVDPTVTIVPL